MEKRTDNRSVRKTKKLIRDEFFALLRQKPIQEISVKELTDAIDINRGTFYFHYKDIYDLLEQLENELLEDFQVVLSEFGTSACSALTSIFQLLEDHAEFCLLLINSNADNRFVNYIKNLVAEHFAIIWEMHRVKTDESINGFFNAFIINGFIGIAEVWLSSEKRKSPEEMAATSSEMVESCFHAFLTSNGTKLESI